MTNMKELHSSGPITAKNAPKILMGIVVFGMLLRIIIAFFTPMIHMHRDSFEYYRQAEIILMGRYLNYFPNGYPFIVAFVKILAPDATSSGIILLWLNIILSTLTIWFVYDIAKRVFNNLTVGLLAALILAIFPPQLNYVRWIMSEIPTIFFLLGAYFFYYRKQYGWCGLFFGLATVVRTNIGPVFILLVVLEALFVKKDSLLKRINFRLLLGAFLPIILVGSYCYIKTGVFSIEGNDRINIMYAVTAYGNHIDFRIGEKYPEINTSAKATKMFLDHMKKEPVEFVKQRLANFWELWGFYASSADGFRAPVSRVLLGACNFFLIFFGLFGWWKNRKDFAASILILPFLIATAIPTLLVAIPRYVYPAHPFMILFGAWTLVYLYNSIRSYKKKAPVVLTEAVD
ncbi:MAG TPA: glycosyltransferase family 39 protein [Puia sp.]